MKAQSRSISHKPTQCKTLDANYCSPSASKSPTTFPFRPRSKLTTPSLSALRRSAMRREGLRSTRMISAFSAFRMNPTDFIAPIVMGLLPWPACCRSSRFGCLDDSQSGCHQPRYRGLTDVEAPRYVGLCFPVSKPLERFCPLMGCQGTRSPEFHATSLGTHSAITRAGEDQLA